MTDPLVEPWVEHFLKLNAETIPGPPGRWRKVYREADVRSVLEWAAEGLRERHRLEEILNGRRPA